MNWWLKLRLRFALWVSFYEFRRAAERVQTLPHYEAARVLTKWRWDASHIQDAEMREKLLALVATVEQTCKLKYERKNPS